MAKRYSEEWKRNVSVGAAKFHSCNKVSAKTREKLSEAGKKGNKIRVYKRLPTNELVTACAVRKRIFAERGRKCEECGWDNKNKFTGQVPVQVDHIDGDRKNNADKNLRVLCPNCHSMTKKYMFYGQSHKGNYGKKGTIRYR